MNESKQRPFVKKFETKDGYYLYDVNSNEFFNVDDVVYALIDRLDDNLGIIPTGNGRNDPLNKYSSAKIEEAKAEIAEIKQQGYFSSHRPRVTHFKGKRFLDTLEETLNSKLEKITLVLTEKCNLRCKYCAYSGEYQYHRTHSSREMPVEVMKKAVDFYLDHSSAIAKKHISFYGGEPFANFKLLKQSAEYIETKCPSNVDYNLTTNGVLLDREKIAHLAENNYGTLVSLDGPQILHDRYRVQKNGRGSFNRIKKNMLLMQSLYPDYYKKRVRFNMVLAPPYDFEAMDEFLSSEEFILRSAGVKFSTVSKKDGTFYDRFSSAERTRHIRSFADLRHSFQRKKSEKQALNTFEERFYRMKFFEIHRRSRSQLPDPSPSHGQCTLGSRGLFVNIDGSFNFCSQVEDVLHLGNVNDGYDLQSIKELYFAMDDLFARRCSGCWAIRLCYKCIKEIHDGGNVDEKKFNIICSHNKGVIESEIANYLKIREKDFHAFDQLNQIAVY